MNIFLGMAEVNMSSNLGYILMNFQIKLISLAQNELVHLQSSTCEQLVKNFRRLARFLGLIIVMVMLLWRHLMNTKMIDIVPQPDLISGEINSLHLSDLRNML